MLIFNENLKLNTRFGLNFVDRLTQQNIIMQLKSLPLIFLGVVLFSCATSNPIVQLDSQDPQSKWLMGRQFSEYKTEDSIRVLVSYYKSQDNRLIFNVEVDNQSNKTISVDAKRFYLVGYDFEGNAIDTVRAINPERELLRMDILRDELRVAQANQQLGLVLESAGQLASAVANSNDLSRSEQLVTNDVQQNELARRRAMINDTRNLQSGVQMNTEYWEGAFLRKTDLESHQYVDGVVLLVPIVDARTYELYVPVEGQKDTAVFKFRQVVFYP